MNCSDCIYYDFKFKECERTGEDVSPSDCCDEGEAYGEGEEE